MIWDGHKEQTRILEQNILNLSFAQFDGCGEFDMPELLLTEIPDDVLENTPLQGFNFALTEKNPERIGCHFFLHDYQFERVWNYPDRYIKVLKKFKFVLSPDFSPYGDMPKILQMYNIYRNHWCCRYWQEHGITVIPTFTIGDSDMIDICCDGIPKNSVIAISTMGEGRWGKYKLLKSCWNTILEKLEPKTILLYGKDLTDDLTGNIIHKRLVSSKVAI